MSKNSSRVYYHQGDVRPYLRAALSRMDPVTHKLHLIDLTGVASVTFALYRDEMLDQSPKFSGVCTVLTPTEKGEVEYPVGATDFNEVGQFWGAWSIDWGSGQVETLPDMGYLSVIVHPKGV